jgi:hypothetical protein
MNAAVRAVLVPVPRAINHPVPPALVPSRRAVADLLGGTEDRS